MKKNFKLISDPEFNMDNSGCLLWKTVVPNYEFVAQFNEVFGTDLTRMEEISIFGNGEFPMFTYVDNVSQFLFFLIDNVECKMDEALKEYDKIMIINGRDAFEKQIAIYNDYYGEQSLWGFKDYLTKSHHESVVAFRQIATCVDFFNYKGSSENVLQVDKKRKNAKASTTSLSGKTSDIAECMECLLFEIEKYYFK